MKTRLLHYLNKAFLPFATFTLVLLVADSAVARTGQEQEAMKEALKLRLERMVYQNAIGNDSVAVSRKQKKDLLNIFDLGKNLRDESNPKERQYIAREILVRANFLIDSCWFLTSTDQAKHSPNAAEILESFWTLYTVAAIYKDDRSYGLYAAQILHELGMPHSDKPAQILIVKALKQLQWWW